MLNRLLTTLRLWNRALTKWKCLWSVGHHAAAATVFRIYSSIKATLPPTAIIHWSSKISMSNGELLVLHGQLKSWCRSSDNTSPNTAHLAKFKNIVLKMRFNCPCKTIHHLTLRFLLKEKRKKKVKRKKTQIGWKLRSNMGSRERCKELFYSKTYVKKLFVLEEAVRGSVVSTILFFL